MIKSSTNVRSSWHRWFSTQMSIRIQITLGWIRAGGARVKCKNCLNMSCIGKRNPAARCSRVKNTPLCSLPSVDSSVLSINRRSMSLGTSQYIFSSSIVMDTMILLAEGFARGATTSGSFLPTPHHSASRPKEKEKVNIRPYS